MTSKRFHTTVHATVRYTNRTEAAHFNASPTSGTSFNVFYCRRTRSDVTFTRFNKLSPEQSPRDKKPWHPILATTARSRVAASARRSPRLVTLRLLRDATRATFFFDAALSENSIAR
jgi:hypothetical protein